MNGIKDITAIYYDENKIHQIDNGHTRYLWIEYCNGEHYAYMSILRNRNDLISEDLVEIRTQEGYDDATFAGLGESQCIHLEMWDDAIPMIFMWDWLTYRALIAEYQGIEGTIHKFLVK